MNGLCDICKNQENRDKQPCRSCPIRNSAFELDLEKIGIVHIVNNDDISEEEIRTMFLKNQPQIYAMED